MPNPVVVPYAHLQLEVLRRPLDSAQYIALTFTRRMRAAGIAGSMGSVGDALDSAAAESYFATLKRELSTATASSPGRPRAPRCSSSSTVFYNRRRLHSSIGYRSPVDFERTTRLDREGATVA